MQTLRCLRQAPEAGGTIPGWHRVPEHLCVVKIVQEGEGLKA